MDDFGSSPYPVSEDTLLLLDNLPSGRGLALDLGTGGGAVAARLVELGWRVIATDINVGALREARMVLDSRESSVVACDLLGCFTYSLSADLLTFNPPYVPADSQTPSLADAAWSGGETGRLVTDRFLSSLSDRRGKIARILLVQSSLSNPGETMTKLRGLGYEVEVRAQRAFFFEEILLLDAH